MPKNRAGCFGPILFVSRLGLLGLLLGLTLENAALAQVVSPVEIKDRALSALQQQNMDDLTRAGEDILAIQFDYPFYLSRKLDLDQAQQQVADQSSIRFDTYQGKTVLAITGNYYAAYSAQKISPGQRARSTFLNVVMPILKAVVPRFQNNQHVEGFAIEISHHIMGKVMGVSMERPENLMVFLPRSGAIKLLSAKKDETAQQAALLQGEIFLNAQPISIWLNDKDKLLPPPVDEHADETSGRTPSDSTQTGAGNGSEPTTSSPAGPVKPKEPPSLPSRDTSASALSAVQLSNQPVVDQIVRELEPQAHFVAYAPPKFVAFRQAIYLELSVNSTLPPSAAGSRYKLAATAFDDHIAHLIRPLVAYFQDAQKDDFDGIGFSTNIHLSGKSAAGSPEAVEFFFPLPSLRCYEKYDCTGQQLLDAGTVLINGERVALDLQIAEGGSSR